MPILTDTLSPDGALVAITLRWSNADAQQHQQTLGSAPPSCNLRALLDTGAEATCVETSVVQQLGLPIEGVTVTNAPAVGGLTFGIQYKACLTLVHPSGNPGDNLELDDVVLIELPLGTLGYQALLGRDLLALCDFHYRGKAGTFTLTY